MEIRREGPVAARLERLIQEHPGPDPERTGPLDAPIRPGSALTRRTAVALYEAALQSRLQDLEARRLKDQGRAYYTIGSSGHEANAVFGHLLHVDDPAYLHYRSGAFVAARARQGTGETPLFDSMLSFAAAAEDPISGGRHKVFGSRSLAIPPQTSTIASHLPKAVGCAYVLARMQRKSIAGAFPHNAIVYCSFGDASVNHATALAGLNAAAAATLHGQPCPILFVCEDNGLGISTRTPATYVETIYRGHAGLHYVQADGRDLPSAYTQALAAIEHCRRTRRPVFFHLRTVRLMGHAGSDVETLYRTEGELIANEERDPMLAFADLLMRTDAVSPSEMRALHGDLQERIRRTGDEACTRRTLATAEEITKPLRLPQPDQLLGRVAGRERRLEVFEGRLPEEDARPRHMAFRLSQALKDILAAYPEAFLFGEDVAKKGGVYHVTDGLYRTFGAGRVFNTILDETTIFGLAIGMAQAGCLPLPEIQYLAYIHNALDQIRGEAASQQFFSRGLFQNPMVVRIAGLAYQKGLGGHFHNDNSVGALLDIPGLIVAIPSRADDAVTMLRTCTAAAAEAGKVCLFLEPIALYMTKDLHTHGDGEWQFPYPQPETMTRLGESRLYGGEKGELLTIATYGNGVPMSLRVRKTLADEGTAIRVLDLRWLAPLPYEAVIENALATDSLLLVDECRDTMGGPSPMLAARLLTDPRCRALTVRRLSAVDTYVPLGSAADLVLIQEADIERAAREMLAGESAR